MTTPVVEIDPFVAPFDETRTVVTETVFDVLPASLGIQFLIGELVGFRHRPVPWETIKTEHTPI